MFDFYSTKYEQILNCKRIKVINNCKVYIELKDFCFLDKKLDKQKHWFIIVATEQTMKMGQQCN